MINVSVTKEEVRRRAEFESDRYRIEITREVDDPNKVTDVVSSSFNLIRQQIDEQKRLDNGAKNNGE